MQTRIADVHIAREEALPPPKELHEALPIFDAAAATVAASRATICSMLDGHDDRLLVVTGPCSIHDPASALDYATRLHAMQPAVDDALFLVMRVYFEKPRTRLGWKGLIYDPDLDGRGDIRKGLLTARSLLLDCARMGVPTGSEILDLATPQYFAELLAWAAIGARTAESQLHRQMASALSAPVGFKNPTSGKLQIAVDAVIVAAQPHRFPSISMDGRAMVVTTTGNPHCHVVLRGSDAGPNYDANSVKAAATLLEAASLPQRIMIDCGHGNSGSDYRRQPAVASDIAAQIAQGSSNIFGVMLESHLVEGRQSLDAKRGVLVYGQSVTDACIGWETTVNVLNELAKAVRNRRETLRQ